MLDSIPVCGASSLSSFVRVQGMHFSGVRERARFEAARRAIDEDASSLTELALRLGYSEQSAFTRAFGRWTGLSPRAYRERARGGLH